MQQNATDEKLRYVVYFIVFEKNYVNVYKICFYLMVFLYGYTTVLPGARLI